MKKHTKMNRKETWKTFFFLSLFKYLNIEHFFEANLINSLINDNFKIIFFK